MDRIYRDFQDEPTLRINVASGLEMCDFTVEGPFSLINGKGEKVLSHVDSPLRWRIKRESLDLAQWVYSLQVDTHRDLERAQQIATAWSDKGYDARVKTTGGQIRIHGNIVTDNTVHRILLGEYNSINDTKRNGWVLLQRGDAQIYQEKIRCVRGRLEVYDAEYILSAKFENAFSLVPADDGTEVVLCCYTIESGDCMKGETRRRLQGPVNFWLNDSGSVNAMVEVPLETYLIQAISHQSDASLAEHAIKSLAVARRGWVLANLGHTHLNDPYDLSMDSDWLEMNDISQKCLDVRQAVEATRGTVLFNKDRVQPTPLTDVCGGHTETDPTIDGNAGVYDVMNYKGDDPRLMDETAAIQWIQSRPDVACKPDATSNTSDHEAFRWEVSYPRPRLEKIINRKTGRDIGQLIDILTLKRGDSGRLQLVQVLGTQGNLLLRSEKQIRQTLSLDELLSSCFIVEKTVGRDGLPLEVTFLGAGSGHGSGLCQAGAMKLAADRADYKQILRHYFPTGELGTVY